MTAVRSALLGVTPDGLWHHPARFAESIDTERSRARCSGSTDSRAQLGRPELAHVHEHVISLAGYPDPIPDGQAAPSSNQTSRTDSDGGERLPVRRRDQLLVRVPVA